MSFSSWQSFGENNSNSNRGGFGNFNSFSNSTSSSAFGSNRFNTNSSINNNNNNNTNISRNARPARPKIPSDGVSFIPDSSANHNANNDYMVDLKLCPNDSITNICCSRNNNTFAVSSWDNNVYIYNSKGEY